MKVYEAVLDTILAAGVKHFAGMVGSTTAPYVATLGGSEGVRYVGVRHEQVAAAMMDAVGRLGGRPGCLLVHGASGGLAAALGVAAAARDYTPMLYVNATQERRAMENEFWQTLDVLTPASGFVKWQARVERADAAVAAVTRALDETVSGRPGVAQVDLPIDVSLEDVEPPGVLPEGGHATPPHRPLPDDEALSAACELLVGAERPVVVVGAGAIYSGAGDAILALAERCRAAVVTSATGRGMVPEDHELVLGPAGILGFEAVGAALREADLLVGIGSRLSDLDLARGSLLADGARIVQVDVEPSAIGRYQPATVGVQADAREFARAAAARLEELPADLLRRRDEWAQAGVKRVRRSRSEWLRSAPDNGRVQPQEVVEAMIEQLPTDSILAHGAGDHGFYGTMVPVSWPGTHLMSAKLGAMGCGLGYALGARLVAPRQTVVACVGDGELMLQIGDLETMVREELEAVVVVFNNFRLGSQRQRVEVFGRAFGVDHTNPDFAKLAELFGCKGFSVSEPGQFGDALRAAREVDGPALIDVLVDPEARPPRIAISREAR